MGMDWIVLWSLGREPVLLHGGEPMLSILLSTPSKNIRINRAPTCQPLATNPPKIEFLVNSLFTLKILRVELCGKGDNLLRCDGQGAKIEGITDVEILVNSLFTMLSRVLCMVLYHVHRSSDLQSE